MSSKTPYYLFCAVTRPLMDAFRVVLKQRVGAMIDPKDLLDPQDHVIRDLLTRYADARNQGLDMIMLPVPSCRYDLETLLMARMLGVPVTIFAFGVFGQMSKAAEYALRIGARAVCQRIEVARSPRDVSMIVFRALAPSAHPDAVRVWADKMDAAVPVAS